MGFKKEVISDSLIRLTLLVSIRPNFTVIHILALSCCQDGIN